MYLLLPFGHTSAREREGGGGEKERERGRREGEREGGREGGREREKERAHAINYMSREK